MNDLTQIVWQYLCMDMFMFLHIEYFVRWQLCIVCYKLAYIEARFPNSTKSRICSSQVEK